jgi:hypothetical protein
MTGTSHDFGGKEERQQKFTLKKFGHGPIYALAAYLGFFRGFGNISTWDIEQLASSGFC